MPLARVDYQLNAAMEGRKERFSGGDPMRRSLLARLESLEAILAPKQVPRICYGWLLTLPSDYVGERHIVSVKQEPTRSPHFEWCEWEERPGPAPSVPTPCFTEADSRP